MAIAHMCELCERITKPNMANFVFLSQEALDQRYCDNCRDILNGIRSAEYKKVHGEYEAKYGKVIQNQAGVINLLQWLLAERPEEFEEYFGTQGIKMLEGAVGDPEKSPFKNQPRI